MKNYQSAHDVQQGHYKSFQPATINRAWKLDTMDFIQLPGKDQVDLLLLNILQSGWNQQL